MLKLLGVLEAFLILSTKKDKDQAVTGQEWSTMMAAIEAHLGRAAGWVDLQTLALILQERVKHKLTPKLFVFNLTCALKLGGTC